MTRLLLSLLRLLVANRSAVLGAASSMSTGQYRRLTPAAAEAGYGPVGGYRRPYRDRRPSARGTSHPDASWVDDDDRWDGTDDAADYSDTDAYGTVDGLGPSYGYPRAEGDAFYDGYAPDDGAGVTHGDSADDFESVGASSVYGHPGDGADGTGRTDVAGRRVPGTDGAGQTPESVRFRAASKGSQSASGGGGDGRAGRSGSPVRGGNGSRVPGAGAAAAGYRGRGSGAAAGGSRAVRSGSGGGRSHGGRAAGRTGVLPPGEPYATGPFTTEPFTTEPFARGRFARDGCTDGRPLAGTVHRPERGGRGSGPGGGSGWGPDGRRPRRRRWIPLRYKWIAALVILGLIFRRAVAWAVLFALSAAFHLVGVGIHLPSVKFGWPWQSVTSNSTTTTPVGPWVLQKIEGISKPALGRVNFNFVFTRKVSKSIGPWPCWYQSTFAAVGHASATVALNPGSAWWAPGTGHYKLRVLSAPQGGKPGHLSVRMMLPMPQLPQSAHDVTIDDLPSKPIDVQHSWTYPGFGCGTLLKPQFDNSVLYAEAQQIAYYKSTHVAQVTKPLIAAAEAEAVQTVRDNFVQPTVNALGYTLDEFTIAWVSR